MLHVLVGGGGGVGGEGEVDPFFFLGTKEFLFKVKGVLR